MSQKSLQTINSSIGTLVRVHTFDRVAEGMTLAIINGLTNLPERLGTVVSVERDNRGTCRVTLDNGKHMTRRGWQSRRLWRLA